MFSAELDSGDESEVKLEHFQFRLNHTPLDGGIDSSYSIPHSGTNIQPVVPMYLISRYLRGVYCRCTATQECRFISHENNTAAAVIPDLQVFRLCRSHTEKIVAPSPKWHRGAGRMFCII